MATFSHSKIPYLGSVVGNKHTEFFNPFLEASFDRNSMKLTIVIWRKLFTSSVKSNGISYAVFSLKISLQVPQVQPQMSIFLPPNKGANSPKNRCGSSQNTPSAPVFAASSIHATIWSLNVFVFRHALYIFISP